MESNEKSMSDFDNFRFDNDLLVIDYIIISY